MSKVVRNDPLDLKFHFSVLKRGEKLARDASVEKAKTLVTKATLMSRAQAETGLISLLANLCRN